MARKKIKDKHQKSDDFLKQFETGGKRNPRSARYMAMRAARASSPVPARVASWTPAASGISVPPGYEGVIPYPDGSTWTNPLNGKVHSISGMKPFLNNGVHYPWRYLTKKGMYHSFASQDKRKGEPARLAAYYGLPWGV